MKARCAQLILQVMGESVTVPTNAVPVIYVGNEDSIPDAVMAVNFLRSGCPAAQVIIDRGIEKFEKNLEMLSLPGEKFEVTGKEITLSRALCKVTRVSKN
jgi:hypothetical protein